jgi:hypothetical protein
MTHTDFLYTPAIEADLAVGSHPLLDPLTPLLPLVAAHWAALYRETGGSTDTATILDLAASLPWTSAAPARW